MKLPRPAVLLTILAVAWGLALLAAPRERTLGSVVRWVFAHASLTQVALVFFVLAAVLAVLYLAGRTTIFPWVEATGWVALGLWLVGFLLSMIPAQMEWGVLVDFAEPRTQLTLRLLAMGLVFLLLTRWVASRLFTAVAQILLSLVVLVLNRSTALVRHPFNPIGLAQDIAIPLSYGLIFLTALLFSAALAYYVGAWRSRTQPAEVGGQP